MGCPEGSTSCSKKTLTSQDRKTITTDLKCYNSAGKEQGQKYYFNYLINTLNLGTVLANPVTSAKNPHPNSISNGYEFYGSFSEGTHTTHINQGGDNTTDQVENFN